MLSEIFAFLNLITCSPSFYVFVVVISHSFSFSFATVSSGTVATPKKASIAS